jgi:hypothetical protein
MVLKSLPGIKRDGTKYEGDFYVDGQWVRFQRGLPRKMWGYRAINKYLTEISRGFTNFVQQRTVYCHSGSARYLQRFTLDGNGNSSVITNRTPLSGFTGSEQNTWMFDVMYDSSSTDNSLIAYVTENISCICSDTQGAIFIGDLLGTAPLTEITLPPGITVSGGIVALHPYLFYYGTAGIIGWSVAGDPTDLTGSGSGTARVAGQKIVKGLTLRAGSGSAPAGLFWAYDSLIRCTFTGGATVFQFDTVSDGITVMSPNGIIEYDGIYYWAGVDRFYMFNGVVRELPNSLNFNWFYDNVNRNYLMKVFAVKVPRFGEIWWCYPRGDATECTHAVVYNVRENTWYDTELPNDGRSAGQYSPAFNGPLLTGVVNIDTSNTRITQEGDIRITQDGRTRGTETNNGYKVWRHEIGVDEIDGANIFPIQSYFELADMSLLANPQGAMNKSIRIDLIEPDFVQAGDMTVQVTGRANARSKEVTGEPKVFTDSAATVPEQVVYFKDIRREMRFKFESNTVGGDYQMGQVIAHIEPADGTVLGGV